MTTPRRRLSTAMRRAASAAVAHQRAQDELHHAFVDVYGFDLALEELGGDELVDGLVYGHGFVPRLAKIDRLVEELKKRETFDDRTTQDT